MRSSLVVAVLLLAGCGGPPPPAPPPPPPSASATVAAPSPPPPAPKAPATVGDAIDPTAKLVGRIDGKALRASPLFGAVLAIAGRLPAGSVLADARKACGFAPEEAIDDLAFSGNFGIDPLDVVAVKLAQPDAAALDCVGKLMSGKPADVGGLPGVAFGPGAATVVDGVLLVGARAAVEQAVERVAARGSHKALPALPAGSVAALSIQPPDAEIRSVEAQLRADASELSLVAEVRAVTPEIAAKLAKEIEADEARTGKDLAEDAAATEALKDVLAGIDVRAEGDRIVLRAGVKGDATKQAAWVGRVAAVVEGETRHAAVRAKTFEARSYLMVLAQYVQIAFEREKVDAKGKVLPHELPPSAPRTPKTVPKGTVYLATEKDWSHPTWKLLHFMPTGPQRYSYELVRSPDRKKVTLRAIGDLDGDGKTSTFERTLTVRKDGSLEVGDLVVKDELE